MIMRRILMLLVLGTFTLAAPPEPARGAAADTELPKRVQEMLDWLPSDTETLIVANGPFEIPAKRPEQLAFAVRLRSITFNLVTDELRSEMRGLQVEIAIEGSRRFRAPSGLGMMPYEGCQLIRFNDSADAALQTALKSCLKKAREVIRIHDQQVAVFQKKSESDVWTIFVTRPRSGILLCATHRGYLEDVLQRMHGAPQVRALPESLPEWRHVDFNARVWAVRHYRREEANNDPSSPFAPRAPASRPDSKAVGMVFWYDADLKLAKVRYLSSADNAVRIVASGWHHPAEKLTPTISLWQPGVVEVEVSAPVGDGSDLGGMFLFVLLAYLGHGIYV